MPQIPLLRMLNGEPVTSLKCALCDLSSFRYLKTNCMDGAGSSNPTYVIAGFAPGQEDDRIGSPMIGANGRLLKELLLEAGISTGLCYVTNCLKCYPDRANPTNKHWNACKAHFERELRQIRPKVLIACGAQAVEWLTGLTGMRSVHGKVFPALLNLGYELPVVPISQPASLWHGLQEEKDAKRREILADLRSVKRLVESGQIVRGTDIATDYQYAYTLADFDRFMAEFEAADRLSCDLETGDINYQPQLFPGKNSRIISIGFSFGDGIGRAIPLHARGITKLTWWEPEELEYITKALIDLLRRKTVFGQNFVAFDQKWIRAHLGLEYCNIDFDTMLAHYLLNEERGTHDLERLALEFTTMPPWKKEFTLEDTERMCFYLCRDVDAGFRLRKAFEQRLSTIQKWLLNELMLPLGNVLMDAEYHGTHVSRENVEKLEFQLLMLLQQDIDTLRQDRCVQAFKLAKGIEFNPESPEQVADLMENYLRLRAVKRTKAGAYSTDKEVLEHYKHIPVVAAVQKIRQTRKLESTYCKGTIEASADDGKVHTSFKQHGTVTGRLASENPNLQNIPRDDTAGKVLQDGKAIKAIFVPPEGYLFLQCDYSQIELRILASISNDPALRQIFLDGLDAHTATAAKVYGVPLSEVTKPQRSNSKTLNFGIAYGMGEESLIEKFIAAGSTKAQAQEFYALHKQTFPGIWQYMADQEAQIRKYRYQETPFGRQRRYTDIDDHAIRMAMNFPIQSIASDLTLLSIVGCDRAFKALGMRSRVQLTVHDSIIFRVPYEEFWAAVRVVAQIMEGYSFPWLTVPIRVDMEVGLDWGNLKKIDRVAQTIL